MRDRLVGRRRRARPSAARSGRCGRFTRPGCPSPRISSAPACASVLGDPQRDDAARVVGRRAERHVGDVDPGAAERRARSRRSTPGRLGTAARSSLTGPPASPASSSARRLSAASLCQASSAAPSSASSAARTSPRREMLTVDRGAQRLAIGAVDPGPELGVGAGDARGVAKARPGRGHAVAAERARGLRDEHVGEHVRQVRDGGHRAVVVGRVDDLRVRADAGQQLVHALEQHAARRRLRRQVPGRAVEEVLARVLDARHLGAGERMAADEALVRARRARRPPAWSSRRRSPRSPAAPRRAPRASPAPSTSTGAQTIATSAPSSARGSSAQASSSAPSSHAERRLAAGAAHVRAEPAAGGHAGRPADEPGADDRDDQRSPVRPLACLRGPQADCACGWRNGSLPAICATCSTLRA